MGGWGLIACLLLIRQFCAISSAPFLSIKPAGRGLGMFGRPLVASGGEGTLLWRLGQRPLAVAMKIGVVAMEMGGGAPWWFGNSLGFFPLNPKISPVHPPAFGAKSLILGKKEPIFKSQPLVFNPNPHF